jgi:hypothetical protein
MSNEYEYTVVAVIQSAYIDDNIPVDVQWYKGRSLAQAISALSGAAVNHEDVDKRLPSIVRYRTLSVRLDIVPVEVLP